MMASSIRGLGSLRSQSAEEGLGGMLWADPPTLNPFHSQDPAVEFDVVQRENTQMLFKTPPHILRLTKGKHRRA